LGNRRDIHGYKVPFKYTLKVLGVLYDEAKLGSECEVRQNSYLCNCLTKHFISIFWVYKVKMKTEEIYSTQQGITLALLACSRMLRPLTQHAFHALMLDTYPCLSFHDCKHFRTNTQSFWWKNLIYSDICKKPHHSLSCPLSP
jgi:hypothetical protein